MNSVVKQPVQLIKKKRYPDCIMYKFRWSNGALSIEPMTALTPEMLVLVHDFELKQGDREEPRPTKYVKPNDELEEKKVEKEKAEKRDKKLLPKAKEQLPPPIQAIMNTAITVDDMDELIKGHKPRKSRPCTVKSIRNDGGRIDFLVVFDDDPESK